MRLTQTRWQRFWRRFTGHVTDDAPFGVPGEGDIEGSCTRRRVRFTKRLPELHLAGPQGLMSLADFLATHDYKLQRHFAHPPIYYDGEIAEDGSVTGTWLMEALNLRLDANGSELPFPRSTGTFQMRRL